MGIIFLFVGVVALLVTLDVIDFRWTVAWRLWPIVFILFGIMVLPFKDWLKAILLLATLAIGVLLYQYENEHHSIWFFSQHMNNLRVILPSI